MMKIYSLLTFLGLSLTTLAQYPPNPTMDDINNAVEEVEYVFEATVMDVKYYPGDEHGTLMSTDDVTRDDMGIGYFPNHVMGYTAALVEICQVYKGHEVLNLGIVEIVNGSSDLLMHLVPKSYIDSTDGDSLVFKYMKPDHYAKPLILKDNIGERFIFFSNPAAPQIETSFETVDNPQILSLSEVGQMHFNFPYWQQNQYDMANNYQHYPVPYIDGSGYFDKHLPFLNRNDLIDFLSNIQTLSIESENFCSDDAYGIDTHEDENGDNIDIDINYESNYQNYQNWNNYVPKRGGRRLKQASSFGLFLEIDNARLTGPSNAPFLEFDIMASATSNTTYFDNCLLRIHYNTGSFGQNVVFNNKIQITRAAAFNNSTYIDPQAFVIDQDTDTIGLPFGTDFQAPSLNRTILTVLPVKMLTIKIKIDQCNTLPDIIAGSTSLTSIFSFFATTASASIVNTTAYTTTQYSGHINDETCKPIITNFTNNIPAGNGSVLTFTGKYFGDRKGSQGTVVFRNADKGNFYPSGSGPNKGGIQHYDVMSWDHNEIKIILPSVIDSATANSSDPDYKFVPGSGDFKLFNRFGHLKKSSFPIEIPYAVFQDINYIPFPTLIYEKINLKLSGENSQNGYTVQLHTNVSSTFPNAKAVIKKAMRDWSCVSGINWKLGNDSTFSSGRDGICGVFLESMSALQSTTKEYAVCTTGTSLGYYMKSFDIKIRNPHPTPLLAWQVDTTGSLGSNNYDFYHAFSHELGHAHLLSHVNDSIGDIMFPTAGTGPYSAGQRKTVWKSPDAINGGIYVTNNLTGVLACATSHTTISPTNCTGLGQHFDEAISEIELEVYPNPVQDDDLHIRFNGSYGKPCLIRVSDLSGKVVKEYKIHNIFENQEYIISLDSVASGMYMIEIEVNNTRKNIAKIIKS